MSASRALRAAAEGLWPRLEPLLPGLTIEVPERVGSTNTALLERARAGDASPCLMVAIEQTGGRGRQGRAWHATPGASLAFSLALPLLPRDWSGLSLAVGVALAEALDDSNPPRISLKWPNDLWLATDDRKLGGILIETVNAGAARLAVIGVGLNIAPQDVPDASSGIACLRELDAQASAASVLERVAEPLVRALKAFQATGFGAVAARFEARDALRGRAVTTTLAGAPEGTALGVAANGALRLRSPQGLHEIASGEVSVRPAPTAHAA